MTESTRSAAVRSRLLSTFAALGALLPLSIAAADVLPQLSAADVAQPAGWDDELRMQEAQDLNPDPRVLEIELEAKITELEILPGTKTRVWTYNGTLPGPVIRARVGDRLIVHFRNSLPEPTTIHWHGLRVPNDMDGAPGVTQDPVPPGGTFRYEFELRDPGTYWYHPHIDSSAQVARGLYGAFIVEDPNEPPGLGDELVLVLSDMSLDPDGTMRPTDEGGAFGDLFGREGNVLLVNGRVMPTLKVRAGKHQRWRVINAARSRYFWLGMRGHSWVHLGGDAGFAERAVDAERVLVVPGERADLVYTPNEEPGTRTTFYWRPFDRGYGTATARGREPMMYIETVPDAPVRPVHFSGELRRIEPIDLAGAIEKTVELTIMSRNRGNMMGINGVAHHYELEARIGETHVWTIVNDTDFAHPFHLHGYFFQVLDESRVPEWKDTVNVPAKSRLRIAVRFDERPGVWMLHCHILDHAEAGMMGHLRVKP